MDATTQTADDAGAPRRPVPKIAKPRKGDRLDRSRDHGKCWSATGHPIAHYYQDGRYFDGQGNRMTMPGDEEREAADAAAQQKRRNAEAAELIRRAEKLKKGEDPEEVEDENGEVDGVNLRKWGLGEASYRFAAVREAIMSKYSRFLASEDQARDYLVEQGVISPGERKKVVIARKRTR